MLRILLDENIPLGLRGLLSKFEVRTADEMGWAGITNGRLLDAAEAAGFQVMITADRSIRAQQRMTGRKLALVVITTNHWDTIKANAAAIITACDAAGLGTYTVVALPRPLRRRRPRRPGKLILWRDVHRRARRKPARSPSQCDWRRFHQS